MRREGTVQRPLAFLPFWKLSLSEFNSSDKEAFCDQVEMSLTAYNINLNYTALTKWLYSTLISSFLPPSTFSSVRIFLVCISGFIRVKISARSLNFIAFSDSSFVLAIFNRSEIERFKPQIA